MTQPTRFPWVLSRVSDLNSRKKLPLAEPVPPILIWASSLWAKYTAESL